MKKIFYIISVFHFLLLTLNIDSQMIVKNGGITNKTNSIFDWQYYQFPFSYGFTDVFFIDLNYGWATYTGNGVARTTNSGLNWDTSSFGPSNYMGGGSFYK